ncbi:MAG TPA: CHAT domain-containing protein [Mycobacteriales bacterium]|nr:CHAT domain-containing protein [Mycobacteriales bacterium]
MSEAIAAIADVIEIDPSGAGSDLANKVGQRLMDHGSNRTGCASCARSIVEGLRDRVGPKFGRGSGWFQLLTDAANVVYWSHDPAAAVSYLDEAWLAPASFPNAATAEAAGQIGRAARVFASCVGHLPTSIREARRRDALERLFIARRALCDQTRVLGLTQTARANLVYHLLGVAISEVELWRDDEAPLAGYVTSAIARLEILSNATIDVLLALEGSASDNLMERIARLPQVIPDVVRRSASRFLVETMHAAFDSGAYELGHAAGEAAIACAGGDHFTVDVRVKVAHNESDRGRQLQLCEALIAEALAGEYDAFPRIHRDRIMRGIADLARKVSVFLTRSRRPTTAWFMQQQAECLLATRQYAIPHVRNEQTEFAVANERDDRLSLHELRQAPTGAGREGVDATPALDGGPLGLLLSKEHVWGLVLELKRSSSAILDGAEFTAEFLQQLKLVEDWRPPRRAPREASWYLDLPNNVQVAAVCLLSAEELARGYVPSLLPEIAVQQLRLAPLSDMRLRLQLAQVAIHEAVAATRPREALRTMREVIPCVRALDHAPSSASISDTIHDIVADSFAMASGAADLLEVCRQVGKRTRELAGDFATNGFGKEAFEVAACGLVAVARWLRADPSLVEELELVERRRQRAGASDVDETLLRAITARMQRPRLNVANGQREKSYAWQSRLQGELAAIQLIYGAGGQPWALIQRSGRQGITHTASPLDLRRDELEPLRLLLESELRPTRRGKPVSALDRLGEVLAPMWSDLLATDFVVFVPHGEFGSLPWHAARWKGHHLIENTSVAFLSSPEPEDDAGKAGHEALVGGWDPSIDAPAEARQVANILQRTGHVSLRPKSAADGKAALLSETARPWLMHVAAHGVLHPWPKSSESSLVLSKSQQVSAAEWLRTGCRPQLAFVNACNLGHSSPGRGDLNGFPLALKSRGTDSIVMALALVSPDGARQFAQRFYEALAETDSLHAYRATVVAAINGGDPPADWVPYVHVGLGVSPVRQKARGSQECSRRRNARRR